jgi:hypothetical protein
MTAKSLRTKKLPFDGSCKGALPSANGATEYDIYTVI